LADYSIGNDDIIFVQRRQPQQQRLPQQSQQPQQPQQLTPQLFLQHTRNDPELLQRILANNPVLGEAILAEDLPTIQRFLDAQAEHNKAQAVEMERRRKLVAMDPFSLEYQKALEGFSFFSFLAHPPLLSFYYSY
jgi:hypothetical protein